MRGRRTLRRSAWLLGCAVAFSAFGANAAQGAASADPAAAQRRVSLEQAVEMALRQHPIARVAQAQIDRAEALVREARAGWLPTLEARATYTRLDSDREFGTRVVAGADQLNANLVLTVPLVAPARWAQSSQAREGAHVAEANAQQLRQQLAVATARAYLAIISQRRVLEASERAKATAQAHLEFARQQVAGGIGTRIDEVRAAQEAALAEVQVHNSRNSLTKAREALGVLTGLSAGVDVASDAVLPAGPDRLDQAIVQAQQGRRDLRALRALHRAVQRKWDDDWTLYAPTLVGTAQPFYQSPSTLTMPETGWQAQLILTIPLYDGGLRYGLHDEHGAQRAEARATLDAAWGQAQADVRTAWEAIGHADRALDAARQAASLAADALSLADLAYRAGATTNLEVVDAERRARDAETSAALAEDACRQARLDLLVATGRFP